MSLSYKPKLSAGVDMDFQFLARLHISIVYTNVIKSSYLPQRCNVLFQTTPHPTPLKVIPV